MIFMDPRLLPSEVLPALQEMFCDDSEWRGFLKKAPGVHLAILVEPFLTYMLDGRKTVESRFSLNRIAPFGRVVSGDLVVLKRSSGPVVGIVRVDRPEFIILTPDTWPKVRSFSDSLCADSGFWRERTEKRYATLLHLGAVRRLEPLAVMKTDRRPWVVLRDPIYS
jgi:hypothetical protein